MRAKAPPIRVLSLEGRTILASDSQPLKALPPILVTPAGIMISSSALQFINAWSPIVSIAILCMVTLVRASQPLNASCSMVRISGGSCISERLVQPSKAKVPIFLRYSGKSSSSSEVHPLNVAKGISCSVGGSVTSESAAQPEKTEPPIETTLSGSATDSSALHPSNVAPASVSMLSGSSIAVKLSQ